VGAKKVGKHTSLEKMKFSFKRENGKGEGGMEDEEKDCKVGINCLT
jgi:hypothetical protein